MCWPNWSGSLSGCRESQCCPKYERGNICQKSASFLKSFRGTTNEVSPFPLHCVANPRKAPTNTLRRIPDVFKSSVHPPCEVSFSNSNVCSIWIYSALANSDVSSPSAWYLTRTAIASSPRPFEISQRGDSGRKLMKVIWSKLGITWRSDGILQPQLLGILNVPKVTPAATIEPRIQFRIKRSLTMRHSYQWSSTSWKAIQ